jgi:hypothetical protein
MTELPVGPAAQEQELLRQQVLGTLQLRCPSVSRLLAKRL